LIAQEFVVPTVLAIALAIMLSINAIHLADHYPSLIDQAAARYSEPKNEPVFFCASYCDWFGANGVLRSRGLAPL
jgi:hypothetical protein